MPKACVFCGDDSVPMHNEHVFADWIAGLYGKMPAGVAQIVDPNGVVRTYGKRAFQDKIPIVCQDRCNGGWMSQLEESVKPTLGPMIKNGSITTLSSTTQRRLAFWAVKTALVLDQFHPADRLIPEAEYGAFYAAKQPLPAHMVWIASRSSPGDNLASSLKEAVPTIEIPTTDPDVELLLRDDIARGERMYRVTFSVGHVAFQVFGHTLPTKLDITEGPGIAAIAHRIWPVGATVQWPPPHPLESVGGLMGWHEAWGKSSIPVMPRPQGSRPNRQARRAAKRGRRTPP